jgi:glycosyltransferase involved in cell wall biosynthesis
MKPLVSILVPAFNAQKWIAETIQSAIGQTWPRKEIIIVDDGSRDETLAILRRFASESIRVVSQENQGAAATRNKAYSLCQGHYIQWLDADDLLSADKIARQMEAAEQCRSKRTLFSSGWGYFMYRTWKARFTPNDLWCDLKPIEWLLRKWEQNLHMQTATWLVSRELTEAAGPWDTQLLGDDDGEYFFRVVRASMDIRFVEKARVFYRITPSNRLSHIGRSGKKIEAHFLGMKLQISYLLALADNERVRTACLNYLQTWLPAFYPDRPDIVEEAQVLATTLGGRLEIPRMGWKYAWIEKPFGPHAAKEAQVRYNRCKSSVVRVWDKILYSLEAPRRKLEVRS